VIYTAEGDRDSSSRKAGFLLRLNYRRLRQVSQDLFEREFNSIRGVDARPNWKGFSTNCYLDTLLDTDYLS
jgi:hypothetical protein